MFKLMYLECRRNKLTTYILVSLILCAVLIVLPYFVCYASKTDNRVEFQNYEAIFKFTGIMSMVMFSTLSAVMYSRFIIDEYTGNRLLLLFSYPVSRQNILLAKILIVLLFITIPMTLGNVFSIVIFSITESISPLIQDTLSIELILEAISLSAVLSLTVSSIAILAMRIGFIKKSIPSVIVAAFVLSGFFGDVVIANWDNSFFSTAILSLGVVAIGVFTVLELINRVNRMDVE